MDRDHAGQSTQRLLLALCLLLLTGCDSDTLPTPLSINPDTPISYTVSPTIDKALPSTITTPLPTPTYELVAHPTIVGYNDVHSFHLRSFSTLTNLKSNTASRPQEIDGDVVLPDQASLNISDVSGLTQRIILGDTEYTRHQPTAQWDNLDGLGESDYKIQISSLLTFITAIRDLTQSSHLIGSEIIGGEPCTHYRYEDMQSTPAYTVDVWVAKSDQRIRQVEQWQTESGFRDYYIATFSKLNQMGNIVAPEAVKRGQTPPPNGVAPLTTITIGYNDLKSFHYSYISDFEGMGGPGINFEQGDVIAPRKSRSVSIVINLGQRFRVDNVVTTMNQYYRVGPGLWSNYTPDLPIYHLPYTQFSLLPLDVTPFIKGSTVVDSESIAGELCLHYHYQEDAETNLRAGKGTITTLDYWVAYSNRHLYKVHRIETSFDTQSDILFTISQVNAVPGDITAPQEVK